MLDGVEYIICRNQGDLYEYIANKGCDMKRFSDAYLKSEFCRKFFDTEYSHFQWADIGEVMDFLEPEICDDMVQWDDSFQFDGAVAFWIGFTYRQLYIETGIKSADLVKIISFDTMCKYYPGLHTIDEQNALETICEDFHLRSR